MAEFIPKSQVQPPYRAARIANFGEFAVLDSPGDLGMPFSLPPDGLADTGCVANLMVGVILEAAVDAELTLALNGVELPGITPHMTVSGSGFGIWNSQLVRTGENEVFIVTFFFLLGSPGVFFSEAVQGTVNWGEIVVSQAKLLSITSGNVVLTGGLLI